MQTIDVELKVLIECLKKKETALRQINSITENQGLVITSDLKHEEIYSFFMQMNVEKQDFIQRVLQCDQVFENVFKNVGPVLDAKPEDFTEEVSSMQDLIRAVMDLDVQIRVGEDNNNELLNRALDNIKHNSNTEGAAALLAPDDKTEPKPSIDGGEYGSSKVIEAYKNQSRRR